MRPTFNDAKAKIRRIEAEAKDVAGKGLKDVSDVKRDGKVLVKFRSTPERDALAVSMDFLDRALSLGWDAGYDSENARVWLHIDQVSA